jgi:SNF2 family DNA or RNA helicase
MKTKPMKHQATGLERSFRKRYFAYIMDQGTGKTWTTLADAERLYCAGDIDALVVIAPKGVHVNWVKREIPTHLEVPCVAWAYRSSAGVRETRKMESDLFRPRERGEVPPLRVLTINYEAAVTKAGNELLQRFLRCTKAMLVLDEAHRIKNPAAKRTKAILELGDLAECRRICTGTPLTNAPMDIFCQMEFLKSGLLGTTSYRAFVAEYADLLPLHHPLMQEMIRQNPRAVSAQIVAKDERGRPRYKNLDKLQRLIQPHSYRVLKKDCLDLPEKIYKTVFFDISPSQRKAYDLMKKEFRMELEGGEVLSVKELAALSKLQQITSGFIIRPDGGMEYIEEGNTRIAALMEVVEDIEGKFIVWARFREELRAVAAALRKAGKRVVEYHGGIGDKEREAGLDAFQHGDADVFVGQQQSGGIGLTLTAAETAVYFSQDFSSENRKQSEDRCHRIGTKGSVVYIDLAAEDTIDEAISRALQYKSAMAAAILDQNLQR